MNQDAAVTFMIVRGRAEAGPYRCPCCGFITLAERGAFEICDVCYWEDDGQDEHDADEVRGGPNHDLSLRQSPPRLRGDRGMQRVLRPVRARLAAPGAPWRRNAVWNGHSPFVVVTFTALPISPALTGPSP
ncbi:CPCC family cysteine-rich protein [Streptomyces sp. NPDC048425]|uniref:CPCC family cysteine-rich protein n=1 Tax=Streptomyces sp. NPDC048425 TaxID=3365548 RepID=UPI00371B3CE1